MIQTYYDAGNGYAECRGRFAFTAQSWYKAIARGRLTLRAEDFRILKSRGPGNPRFDWNGVQSYYDEGHTYRERRAFFGFSAASWTNAVRRGALHARAREWSIKDVVARARSRSHLKRRLLRAGVLANQCEICGLSEWRGMPLAIQIDHANGDAKGNRLENLRMLCPNCHSQTETWGGRNTKLKRSRVA